MADDMEWFDEAAGSVGRPYSLTRGRTSATNDLDLATQVISTGSEPEFRHIMEPEQVQIVKLCSGRWLSVAEVSALLKVPLVVARVQLSDLIDQRMIRAAAPVANMDKPGQLQLLHTILDRLHAL
ncbi:MAG: DUF742 domain-containing protein [Actinocatenispora sp.]